jgi:hypothetical protein
LFLANLQKAVSSIKADTKTIELNGLFAIVSERENVPRGFARKVATLFQINDDGLIERIYFVMALPKLTG